MDSAPQTRCWDQPIDLPFTTRNLRPQFGVLDTQLIYNYLNEKGYKDTRAVTLTVNDEVPATCWAILSGYFDQVRILSIYFNYRSAKLDVSMFKMKSLRHVHLYNLASTTQRDRALFPDSVIGLSLSFGDGFNFEAPYTQSIHPSVDPLKNLETLDIIENDAFDVFYRLDQRAPNLRKSLTSLHIQSTTGHDFLEMEPQSTAERACIGRLEFYSNLKSLTLAVGNKFDDINQLRDIISHLPPNLETFKFRGTDQLISENATQTDCVTEWTEKFEDPTFLPNLKEFRFKLDMLPLDVDRKREATGLALEEKQLHLNFSGSGNPRFLMDAARLQKTYRSCKPLLDAARKRGVEIKDFGETHRAGWKVAEVDRHWPKE